VDSHHRGKIWARSTEESLLRRFMTAYSESPRTPTARRRAVCRRNLTFTLLASQLDVTEPEVVYRGRPWPLGPIAWPSRTIWRPYWPKYWLYWGTSVSQSPWPWTPSQKFPALPLSAKENLPFSPISRYIHRVPKKGRHQTHGRNSVIS